jgi:short-subunit dehydrogenase
MEYRGRTAIVTGASSGIGAAFARELSARGCRVVLVARREQRLKQLASELGDAYVLPADLSQEGAAAAIRSETDALGLRVDILVNNAGFATYGSYEAIDPKRDHALVMVNAASVVDLTHAYLPDMVAAGSGAIINVSSAAAFQPMPYQATYAASKAFVQSLSEALWAENHARGVRVVAVCPSATDTEYFEALGGAEEAQIGPKRPPAGVVRDALRAVDRDRPHVVVGYPWKLTALIPRLLPRTAVARVGERLMRPRTPTRP